MQRAPLSIGDRFVNLSGGGAGYGEPLDRAPQDVLEDVIDGYAPRKSAWDTYGVRVRTGKVLELSPSGLPAPVSPEPRQLDHTEWPHPACSRPGKRAGRTQMNDTPRRGVRAVRIIARRRRALVALVAAVGCVIITACASSGSSTASSGTASGASSVSGTLSIGDTVAPPTLDPSQSASSNVDEIDRAVYDALVQFTNGPNPTLKPDLATSWTVSSNGLTYTFNLRSGVTFHNGAKVTAQDVKYSLDRIKSIGTGIYTELSAYASSKVIAPTKIVITLKPEPEFPRRPFRVYILNSALVQAHAGTNQCQTWLATHEAGSGPYELTQFVANESDSVADFKKYWGGWSGKHVADVVWHYYTKGQRSGSAAERHRRTSPRGFPPTLTRRSLRRAATP